jgi:hypothetical protein
MARIISSEEPIGGVGYQYNVEGMGGIIAVITKHGPGIASQGEVESLLFSAAMVDSALDGEVAGQAKADIAQNRGYKAGYDRGIKETIADANASLERAGIACTGSLAARIERLASERDRLAEIIQNRDVR